VKQRLEFLEANLPRSGDLALAPEQVERLAGRVEIEGESLVDPAVLVMGDQFIETLDIRFQSPPPPAPGAPRRPRACYAPLRGLSSEGASGEMPASVGGADC